MIRSVIRPTRRALLLAAALFLFAPAALAQVALQPVEPLRPRAALVKPVRATIDPALHLPDVVYVKFRDESPVREATGTLAADGLRALGHDARALDAFTPRDGFSWSRVHTLDEHRLEAMRRTAQANLGREVADMRVEFFLRIPDGRDAASVIDALNALDSVEIALPAPRPAAPPLPPDFEAQQGYLNPSPAGVDARHAWLDEATTGAGVRIADLEYFFDPDHQDLPPVQVVGTMADPGFGPDHGTAVLGQLGAIDNGWGVTGIAHGATLIFGPTWNGFSWNVGGAILNVANQMDPGDVILIEQQMNGPNATGAGQFGLVPIEWWPSWHNAVLTAVGNGVIVVMAAGNGQQNLDAPEYSTGNNGHWPFLPENDSGSIIVGAGAAATGFGPSTTPRSRLSFSNYGSRVNLQGWGEMVMTTGYGSAHNSEGPTLTYIFNFSGTSSASPIVAGAAALVQAVHKQLYSGETLTCPELRDVLMATGAPQESGANPASQNIGPLPDVKAAAELIALDPADLNADGVVNGTDLGLLLLAWGACPAPPAECPGDLNADGFVDGTDLGLLLLAWTSP